MDSKNSGRPEKPINWKRVNELLEAGCSGAQIASNIGIHKDTLYDRTVKEFNMSFTDYSAIFAQKGESLLLEKQYLKALKGDNSMLIWLGKNRLKQRDHDDKMLVSGEEKEKLDKALELIDYLQSKSTQSNISLINSNNESKS